MSIDQYSPIPSSNDLTNYFKTGMRPSSVKNAGWDIMADIASYEVSLPTAGGTPNALTVSNGRSFGSLVTGLMQILNPASANTSAATFAPDSLAAAPIHAAGAALVGGEMQPNVPVFLKYDGTTWNLLNPVIGPLGILSGGLEATIFTANGNFTPKATAKYLVLGIGGGGGGGGGGGSSNTGTAGGSGGSGGGGGQIGWSIISLTAGTAYAIVIGSGGSAGSAGGVNTGGGDGGAGGVTTFNGITTGAAGVGGRGASASCSALGLGMAGSTGGGNGGAQGGAKVGLGNTPGNAGNNAANNSGGGGGGGSGGATNGTGQVGGAGGTGGSGILIVIRA